MMSLLKQAIKNYFIKNLTVPDLIQSLTRLKEKGFHPNVIYDIGAFQGDFMLTSKKIWPKATVVCFEPLTKKIELLKQLSEKTPDVRIIEGLVGNKNLENVEFHENETASSILEEHISKDFQTSFKKLRTIDKCIEEFSLPNPDFIKIDTQGYEYEVLEGALQALPHVQVVLAELNFIDIHKNVKLASEVIKFLNEKGFVMFDITEIHRRPSDKAIWQTDFLFVKEDSAFRASKKW